jgi:hypothetical protein
VPGLALGAYDSDAAFENILAADVQTAFDLACLRYSAAGHGPFISVGLGKKLDIKPGISQFACGRWNFRLAALRASVWAGLCLQFSAVGDTPVRQDGQSIGGIFAKAALSILAGMLETLWATSAAHRHALGWHHDVRHFSICRYVDDVLLLTRTLCSNHASDALKLVYREKVKFSLVSFGPSATWTDLDLNVQVDLYGTASLSLSLRSPNEAWLQDPLGTKRGKVTFLPFLDHLPCPIAHLAAVLASRLHRANRLGLDVRLGLRRCAHDILELCLLGYPFGVVRAAAHFVPRGLSGAIALRLLVRALRKSWPHVPRSS